MLLIIKSTPAKSFIKHFYVKGSHAMHLDKQLQAG
jgi:hypothetical protein